MGKAKPSRGRKHMTPQLQSTDERLWSPALAGPACPARPDAVLNAQMGTASHSGLSFRHRGKPLCYNDVLCRLTPSTGQNETLTPCLQQQITPKHAYVTLH